MAKATAPKANRKTGGTRIRSKKAAANNNFMPTGRDTLAAQYIAGMLDSRWTEVRRRPDQMKIIARAYELADAQIEYALGQE